MLIRKATSAQVEHAAASIGAEAVNQSRDARRFVLRPLPGCVYRRRSAGFGGRGRRVHAVCWHGHREFFRALFALAPEATVQTAQTERCAFKRYTAANFEDVFDETDKNIGPPIDPMNYSQACECPEGGFAPKDRPRPTPELGAFLRQKEAEARDAVRFSTLAPDGHGGAVETHVRTIRRADILACPHIIMVPAHYRADGTCRCNDPEHVEMVEWGYNWNGKAWVG